MKARRANTTPKTTVTPATSPALSLDPDRADQEIVLARHTIKLTNLDKIFWTRPRVLKRDIINYYYQMAPVIIPYLKDRPLTQKRYPRGVVISSATRKVSGGSRARRETRGPGNLSTARGTTRATRDTQAPKYFYQKRVPAKHPGFVKTVMVHHAKGSIRYVMANNAPTLMWLANLADLEMHPWYSRKGSLNRPDHVVFDLDPSGPGSPRDLDNVREVALLVKKVLDDFNLESLVKSSGSRGLHIYVPIRNNVSYNQTKFFAKWVARQVHDLAPRLTTLEFFLARRRGIYIDYLQNVRGKTLAAPYSLRAKPGAPVAAPLDWSEIKKGFRITQFNIKNMPALIKRRGDIFLPMLNLRQNLKPVLKKIHRPGQAGPDRLNRQAAQQKDQQRGTNRESGPQHRR